MPSTPCSSVVQPLLFWPRPPRGGAAWRASLALSLAAGLSLSGCVLEDELENATRPVDADGDGFSEDVDCNDLHPAINPDAREICDGDPTTGEGEQDNNCNGLRGDDDPTLDTTQLAGTWFRDADGDGFGDRGDSSAARFSGCVKPEGFIDVGDDCDDTNSSVNPESREICGDDIDNDCDDLVDDFADPESVDETESAAPIWFRDFDDDGFGDRDNRRVSCARPEGYVAPQLDSDDPRVDDWSTGSIDVAALPTTAFDCDDGDALINPDAEELCDDPDNVVDSDCDGSPDDGAVGNTYFRDVDGDGVGDESVSVTSCGSAPSGYRSEAGDCDDTNFTIKPGAADPGGLACDGQDNDCDGTPDDGTGTFRWCRDSDGDGAPDSTQCVFQYCQPEAATTIESYISVSEVFVGQGDSEWTDCDDTSSLVAPGADEYCDAIDNNCNGFVDETPAADAVTWYTDFDNDGYGDPAAATTDACTLPSGYSANADDCDDAAANVNPTATEVCNSGVAEDCVASTTDCMMDGGYSGRLDEVGDSDGIVGYAWLAAVGPSASAAAGTQVARGGDLDGDGDAELVVYAPFSGNGKLFIVSAVADLDGVRSLSTLETGPTLTGTGTSALGMQVSAHADLLGVASTDYLLVGVPGAAGGGAVAVYEGATITASSADRGYADAGLRLLGTGATTGFGGIADADDFDGDGTADLLIGDAVAGTSTVSAGGEGLHLVFGPLSDDGDSSLASFSNLALLSGAVFAGASAGDVDSDGVADLLWADASGLGLTLGGALADCSVATTCADARLSIDGTFSTYSSQPVVLRALGDLNNDGYADFGAGLPFADAVSGGDEGEVAIWFGTGTGWTGSIAPSLGFIGAEDDAGAGAALDGGVDLDLDGRDDLVLGVPGDDGITGAAYVFYGAELVEGAAYSVYTARTFVTGDSRAATGFGRSVAILPGLLSDGTPDLAVGAPLLSSGAGGVFIFAQRE
ncbi:MAG: putative metal-binding motif-containing protein [Deltaproteobacteria bacterium]|nr:putative metal-binding motif-containing protein [Deltaproteobacteria bacterium]